MWVAPARLSLNRENVSDMLLCSSVLLNVSDRPESLSQSPGSLSHQRRNAFSILSVEDVPARHQQTFPGDPALPNHPTETHLHTDSPTDDQRIRDLYTRD